jgi:outer membrane protein OmpA-like peptidoglycan-associated protein
MKALSKVVTAIIIATALAACASAQMPAPAGSAPQRYSGALLIWFEGQSFRADGETEPWAFGMSPTAMRELAQAYPEGYAPRGTHTVIVADVEGELRPVDPELRRYGCVGGCYDHYLMISRVHEARLLRSACETITRQVYFASNASALDATSLEIIEDAVRQVRRGACNVSRVSIVGHTDTVGAAARNIELSLDRAGVVRDALVTRGIEAALIAAEGAGEERLVRRTADNVSEPTNRFVEIVIESPTAEAP